MQIVLNMYATMNFATLTVVNLTRLRDLGTDQWCATYSIILNGQALHELAMTRPNSKSLTGGKSFRTWQWNGTCSSLLTCTAPTMAMNKSVIVMWCTVRAFACCADYNPPAVKMGKSYILEKNLLCNRSQTFYAIKYFHEVQVHC